MIVVCEPICWGLEHVPINASILEILRLALPSEEIVFCGERSHLKNVSAQMGAGISSSIVWNAIKLPPRLTKDRNRWIVDYKLLKSLTRMFSKDTNSHLLLTATAPSTLVALKFLIKYVYRKRTAQVILHGNLSMLSGWRSRNPIIRIQDLRTALVVPDSGKVRYIVLETSIKEAMLNVLPSLVGKVDVLDHPIPPSEGEQSIGDLSMPLQFGFLGLASEAKGFPFYLTVASELSMKYPQRVEFNAIGTVPCDQEKLEMIALKRKPGFRILNRDKFTRYLKELHFVCFPYQSGHYEFSASGALLDSIGWEKPFIAMRLPIFENLFSRFGDIGYLCATEAEFRETIDGIIKDKDIARYRKQILALRKVGESRTPEILASKYRKIYKKLRIKQ